MPTVLLTGFEPFRQHAVNPTQLIAERLHGETIDGASVTALTLPVVFGEDIRLVRAAIESVRPSIILSLGLNAGSPSIDVELFAINHRNGEERGPLIPIVEDGPAAYFATIDVDEIATAICLDTGLAARRHG